MTMLSVSGQHPVHNFHHLQVLHDFEEREEPRDEEAVQ